MVLSWIKRLMHVAPSGREAYGPVSHARRKWVNLFAEKLEDRTLLSSNPVAVQQLFGNASASTSSTSYSIVPGLSTTVSLASAQTVDISSVLNVYKSFSDSHVDVLAGAIFVDGSEYYSQGASLTPTGGYNVHETMPLHYAGVNLSAGTHTISIEWESTYGYYIYLDGANSSLTITSYNLLPGAAASVAVQQAFSSTTTTSSTSFSVVPGLSTTISLSSAQTVAISAIVDLYTWYSGTATAITALFVDGTQVTNGQFTTLNDTSETVPLNDIDVNLTAGNHVVAVEFLASLGSTDPVGELANSSLTVTAYNPLPGGAAPVSTQRFTNVSGSTSSGSYSVVPGLTASESLSASQTVDINSVLNVYANGGAPNYLIDAIFVDGVSIDSKEIFLNPSNELPVEMHDAITLSAGAHTIQVEWASDYGYNITLLNSSDLNIIAYNPVTPTTTYVNSAWSSDLNGQTITDANPVTSGNQSAVYGLDAFSTVGAAIAAVSAAGTIEVNTGSYNEAVNLTNGDTMKLLGAGPTTVGTVTFGSLTGASGTTLDTGSIGSLANTLVEGTLGTSTPFAGNLSGPGGLTISSGTLTLNGNNSYSGTTTISASGNLQAGSATAFSANSSVNDLGSLNLNGFSNSIAALTGTDIITDSGAAATLTVTGGGSFSGMIYGANISLTVGGSSQTLSLLGNNAFSGLTTINATDTLIGDLSVTSAITVAGTLAPVGNGQTTGTFNTGPLTFNGGSTFKAVIAGHTTNSYDQANVTGAVTINANTNLSLSLSGYAIQPGDQYTLIQDTGGVTGTFDHLNGVATTLTEGALLPNFLNSGYTATITYLAGAGHNVAIIVEPTHGFVVTNASNSSSVEGSLLWAVAAASNDTSGSAITIGFAGGIGQAFATPQTILLTGTLNITNTTSGESIVINGPTSALTIQGGGSSSNFSIFNVGGSTTVSINNLIITHGNTSTGGGINNGGQLTISNCTFTNDAASYGGGAVFSESALYVNNCTFSSNSASNNYGGSIYEAYATATVSNSTFNTDSAGVGGAIDTYYAALSLSNCTFSSDSAAYGGGAVNSYGTTLNVSDSTFYGNSTGSGQGTVTATGGGTATLVDTVIANCLSGGDLYKDTSTSFAGNNDLIDDASAGTSGSNGYFGASSFYNVAAGLDPNGLQSNGGSTQTIALVPGSRAIGGGVNIAGVTTDQRGVSRPTGTPDIGAFQSRSFTLSVNSGGSPQTTDVGLNFANALTVTVTSSSGDPVAGGVVTFTVPSSGASASLSSNTATIGSTRQASVTASASGGAGSYSVSASATGIASPGTFSLTNNSVPAISTSSLPAGTFSQAYSQTLTGTGGTSPYSYAVTAGSLPTGLSLNASTGAITGTPTNAAGSPFSFTVTLTDAVGGTANKVLTIAINQASTLTTVGTSQTGPFSTTTLFTFTATIASTPVTTVSAGTVTFYAGPGSTNPIGSPINVSGGTATSIATTLPAGSDTVTAVFSGATNYSGSQGTANVTVSTTATTTSLTDNGPNASTTGQAVNFTGAVSGGVPNGDTVSLEDASNSNTVVATTTTSGGNGSFSFSVSSLSTGTHNLFAVFAGDATYATSQSSQVTQTVNLPAPVVTGFAVNGDAGDNLSGSNSRVAALSFTFNEAVTLGSGAFTLALHNNVNVNGTAGQHPGVLPTTLHWSSTDNIHWTVTFAGTNAINVNVGADGHVTIMDGVYDVTVVANQVHAAGAPTISMASNSTQTFWALFGDTGASDTITSGTIGDGHTTIGVGNGDFNAFANAYQATGYNLVNGYKPGLDVDGDGSIGNVDFNAFANNYQTIWTF